MPKVMAEAKASYGGARVLVTGATGFIGRHLVDALFGYGAHVGIVARTVSRQHLLPWNPKTDALVSLFEADICDYRALETAFIWADGGTVFHLAAKNSVDNSYRETEEYFRVNLEGTKRVADLAQRYGNRLVHLSTSEIYGRQDTFPISETAAPDPRSPYAASKLAGEALVRSYIKSFALDAVVLRPFNVFGPGQSERAVIPTIINQVKAGGVVHLGHTFPTRDWTYVTDTVNAITRAGVGECEGLIMNIATGIDCSVKDAFLVVREISGREIDFTHDQDRERPMPSEIPNLIGDASVAKAVLGWKPTIGFRDGLRKCWQL